MNARDYQPVDIKITGLPAAAALRLIRAMIRSELIARIAVQNPRLYAKDVEAVVTAIFDRITEALAAGDRVELRDFGTFSVRDRDARSGRNPRTGEVVRVEAKGAVQFKTGKGMQVRLNHRQTEVKERHARQLDLIYEDDFEAVQR